VPLACHNYHVTFGCFPVSIGPWFQGPSPAAERNGKGWIVSVLPFMEQDPLYKQFVPGFNGDMSSGGGIARPECREAMRTQLGALQCPSDPSAVKLSTEEHQWNGIEVAVTSYKGVIGDTQMGGTTSIHQGTLPDCHATVGCNGIFYRCSYQEGGVAIRDILDGTSNTFMIGEDVPKYNSHSAAYYSNGDYASCHAALNYFPDLQNVLRTDWWNVMSFRSLHPGGAHFCMADGSVKYVAESIDHMLYRALSTKAGGEVVTLP